MFQEGVTSREFKLSPSCRSGEGQELWTVLFALWERRGWSLHHMVLFGREDSCLIEDRKLYSTTAEAIWTQPHGQRPVVHRYAQLLQKKKKIILTLGHDLGNAGHC